MAYNDDDAQRELSSAIYSSNKDMNSPLYQALLKQTMQQPQGNMGIGNVIAQLLGSFALTQADPNRQGSWAFNRNLANDIGQSATQDMNFGI